MYTRKRRKLDDHVSNAMKLRWSVREDRLKKMSISMKFNIYLFQKGIRKAFQIDGRYASYFMEDLKHQYPTESHKQILNRFASFLGNITGFDDVLLHSYKFGIVIVRSSTLLKTFDILHFHDLSDTKLHEYIGKLLDITVGLAGCHWRSGQRHGPSGTCQREWRHRNTVEIGERL